jgi:pilus assembly protein CpaF
VSPEEILEVGRKKRRDDGDKAMSTLMSPIAVVRKGEAQADTRHPKYQEIKSRVHTDLLNRLNLDRLTTVKREVAEPEIRSLIIGMLELESKTTPLSLRERDQLISDVLNELFGLGPLEELLRDPSISDILVNRPQQIYVERNGLLEETKVVFKDDRHLLRIIERIVSSVGRRIDESSPMVDARLADGSRVNAIIPPLALDGPVLSIRRFRTDKLQAVDLVTRESLSQPMLDLLRMAVSSRLNVIVSGGTGAGKTTLLNVLSSFISEHERVVTIEDAAELLLRQRHVVRLETRPPNIEGKGAVRQRELMINALRMRPDRIVVGEVRGDEALDMLQAMNTGHDGSLTTVHANSPRDALYRLDTMVAMANLNLPERAIRQQIASAINFIVQVTRLSDGSRKVSAISEITGMEGEVITIQDIFVFERTGLRPDGRVTGRFRATGIRPKCSAHFAQSGIEMPGTMFEHVQTVG